MRKQQFTMMRDIYRLIPGNRRRGFFKSVLFTLLLAISDLVGIVALVSILLLVLDEKVVLSNEVIARIYRIGGFTNINAFIRAVSLIVLAVIALKSVLCLWLQNSINRYVFSLYSYFSIRMFDINLQRGLLFIRDHHTAQLVNNVNGVCLRFAEGVVAPMMTIASESLLLVMMGTLLLFYNPFIVLLAAIVFIPMAILYSRTFRRRMERNGKMENTLFVRQNKTMYEALRGYPDIVINNAEAYFSKKFRYGLRELCSYRLKTTLTRLISGRAVEFSLVLGIVAVIFIGLWAGYPLSGLKLTLGVFAVAAYRIVPAVSRIVNNRIEYKRNLFAIEILQDTMDQAHPVPPADRSVERLPFHHSIVIDKISFHYGERQNILENFSLTIRKGERIGIRGGSGVGKSTLFNIICALFEPSSGSIEVDGVRIDGNNRRKWQNNLACVSQEVFIPDVTIAENIAFGIEPDRIDRERLWNAIETASLKDWVSSLPDGIDTIAGESGCRLSGGQRQRIGIARALYKEASVLLFDEATSSLDIQTEKEIVTAIEHLSATRRELTMIIISHRDQTLAFCDRIIELEPVS